MNQPSFRFNPVHLHRTYGVTYIVESLGAEQTISYEITLKGVKKIPGTGFLFDIDKAPVYINQQLPEKMIDKLVARCGKVLYPLQVTVNDNGQFIGVANAAQIAAAWEAEKPALLEYFTGSVTEEIVAYMDLAVSSPRHIYQSLCRDWFMALYFADLYQPGSDIMERQLTTALPVMPYTAPVLFNIIQQPVQHQTDSGCLVLQQKGTCSDPRSVEDLSDEKEIPLSQQLYGIHTPLKGQVDITYKLYHKDYSINSVTGRCSLPGKDGAEKNVTFSIYHLREKDKAPAPVMSILLPEETDPGKKKSIFSFFFKR
ncbi:hypothetical protein [Chitinophaga arvensicola]|uniref:Uncharacterized protein n=1 Tax=Chitinophaga arvensicola TaxID=29529 RepID=A0A1I0SD81_9BACT|nr:hypothetical protein [Chitinophaga arvensicola]SEW55898.1 hypothetical protein SAMN04488122_6507 [Chitinophaga arvensicola]